MEVDNARVYGLEHSVVASGLPMRTTHNAHWYCEEVFSVDAFGRNEPSNDKHFTRVDNLSSFATGSGHCNFLSGIVVQMNITATVKWWQQWQRYHFQQIVSSQSTMHRLKDMMKEGTIRFNEKTSPVVIAEFMKLKDDPTITDEQLAYSCPMGLELTARVSTNYLQLRTIFSQRRHHKLQEWHDFIDFIKTLPYAEEFILVCADK